MKRFLQPAEFSEVYGTDNLQAWPLGDSLAYTRWLAQVHYENFHVVSLLLPRRLRQDFRNVYSFCRWSDDLGDEIEDPRRSLELLEWWSGELKAMYRGVVRHPVFVALKQTVETHGIPEQPFADLIHAFVQDQRVTRYATYEDLLGYCRYSANPVGRLVLHLCGYTDEPRRQLSDDTCTALQLANFWQDVGRDWEKGRVYIPLEEMKRHSYSIEHLEQDLKQGVARPAFRNLMQELVHRTQKLFQKGLPLIDLVDRCLSVDVELFSGGGLAVLEMIRRQDYDTVARRPKLGKWDRFKLLSRAVSRRIIGRPRLKTRTQHAYR